MTRIIALTLGIAALTGCVFVDPSPPVHHDPVVVVTNSPPVVFDGWSACSFDAGYNDDIWSFEADVDDADGVLDVVQVWADVYDDNTGELVRSFELYPGADPAVWYADFLASTTYLDCWYGGYSVDLVAYDSLDDYGVLTIYPDTYR